MGNAEYMGTHPIFESDFDCLTDGLYIWTNNSTWRTQHQPRVQVFAEDLAAEDAVVAVHGKCGSVHVRLIPAPRGTGLVCGPVPKKLMQMAGLEDVYTSACGGTSTLGNFAKATFQAICRTNDFLTPELWKDDTLGAPPF